MRSVWAVALFFFSLGGAAHAAPPSKYPSANQPVVGPQGTLEAVARGYRDRSADSILAHYTADYRFHSFGDTLVQYTGGSGRGEAEMVLRNLFGGVIRGADTLLAPADSVGLTLDGFRDGVDPEHPDSTQHYQVVEVGRFEMGVRVGDQRMVTMSNKHIFHFVRGDVAVLVAGQSADPDRWYVRRWLEDVSGVLEALTQRQGECGEPAAPTAGPRSGGTAEIGVAALAIRPLMNPACAKLQVTCDLPEAGQARIEVYDVSGRRVNRREVSVTGPARMSVEAGSGAKLKPGAYWVRLTQGPRATTRMVMVAR